MRVIQTEQSLGIKSGVEFLLQHLETMKTDLQLQGTFALLSKSEKTFFMVKVFIKVFTYL